MVINKDLLDSKMLRLGFREVTLGTAMLREAVPLWAPGALITKDIYPAIAAQFQSTPSRVERAMRHAIESAFQRADLGEVENIFGHTISAYSGKPTVGEFLSRMSRVCACAD